MERDDAMLNSKDVARILDLSPDTVNEFARKSILPASRRAGSGGSAGATSHRSSASCAA